MDQKKNTSEVTLVDRAKAGEDEAFREIHDLYKNKIFNYLNRLIGNRHRAEELTQETFVLVHQHLLRQKDSTKFRSWLFAIATNAARNAFRKQNSEKRLFQGSETHSASQEEYYETFEHIQDHKHRPDRIAQQKELCAKIEACLHNLPAKYRTVLTLCDVQGMSYAEAAEILKRSRNDIGVNLLRARRKLRAMINLDEYDIAFLFSMDRLYQARVRLNHYVYYQYLLGAYLDSELSVSQKSAMSDHVPTCSRCQDEIVDLERIKIVLGLLPELVVSAAYEEHFEAWFSTQTPLLEPVSDFKYRLSILKDMLRQHVWIPIPTRWGLSFASLLLVVVVSVTVLQESRIKPRYAYQGAILGYDARRETWRPVTREAQFQKKSLIQVAAHSQADFSFPDLYGIRIRESSTVQIEDIVRDKNDRMTQLRLKEGMILAKMHPSFAPREFEILIDDARITASHAAFAVHKDSSETFRIELVTGELFVRSPHFEHTVREREFFSWNEAHGMTTGALDILRINDLLSELTRMEPFWLLAPYRITDLSAELFLPASSTRLQDALHLRFVKLGGADKASVKEALDKALVMDKKEPPNNWKALVTYLTKFYPEEDYTPPILIFLASHMLQQGHEQISIEILAHVIEGKHPHWASLAQSMTDWIYEHNPPEPSFILK